MAEHVAAEGCVGSVSEVFDGEPPHAPGGCPAQAWSVAELLRVALALEDPADPVAREPASLLHLR
jgi:glycogen debranching enzyme